MCTTRFALSPVILLIIFGLQLAMSESTHALDLTGPWYAGSDGGPPTVTNPNSNSFTFGDATSSADAGALWTYFADQTLDVDNEFVEVSFGLTYNDSATGGPLSSLRFGLYDHNGGTVEMDLSTSNNDPGMEPARGYFTGISEVENPPQFFARGNSATSVSPSSANGLTSYDDGDLINTMSTLVAGVEHDMALRIRRINALTYETSVAVNGEVALAITSDIVASTFNSFYLLNTGQNNVDSMTFSDITVTLDVAVAPSPGDVNGDGEVDIAIDFEAIRSNFLLTGATRLQGDLSDDGVVNFNDFKIWKVDFQNLNGFAPNVSLASIPEPATCTLATLAGGLALFVRRFRHRA
jgi:hypothetical protein